MTNSNSIDLQTKFESMIYFLQNQTRIISVLLLSCALLFSAVSISAQEEDDGDEAEFTQGEDTTAVSQDKDDPVLIFNQAQDAHEKGDLKTALALYEKAIKAYPEFPEAEFQRGSIYKTQGNPALAEKSFRRAIELRRDWTLPIAELGALLIQSGSYFEAESLLNRAIRIDKMSFPAYVALTELKIKTKSSKEELKLLLGKLQYLTTKSKIPASIWASRGAIERTLRKFDSAKTSIKRALLIDKKNALALQETIELSLVDRDYKSAVRNAEKLLSKFPYSTNAKMLLARSLFFDGKTTDAIKTLDSIENPTEDVSKLKTIISLNGNNNIEDLEKLLSKDENNVSILGRLCILSRTAQPKKALTYCYKVSTLEPNEINHAIGFGAALVQEKRYLDAINILRKLLESSPENYTIRANLAISLFQLKRFEEAKIEYEWLTKKQPNLAVGYYFLAISHDHLKEYLDAMANYQLFLGLADDTLKLEVEKVNLRLPKLQKLIKRGKGKKRR